MAMAMPVGRPSGGDPVATAMPGVRPSVGDLVATAMPGGRPPGSDLSHSIMKMTMLLFLVGGNAAGGEGDIPAGEGDLPSAPEGPGGFTQTQTSAAMLVMTIWTSGVLFGITIGWVAFGRRATNAADPVPPPPPPPAADPVPPPPPPPAADPVPPPSLAADPPRERRPLPDVHFSVRAGRVAHLGLTLCGHLRQVRSADIKSLPICRDCACLW